MIFKNLFHVKPFIPLTSFGVELRISFPFLRFIFVYIFDMFSGQVEHQHKIISIFDKDMEFPTFYVVV